MNDKIRFVSDSRGWNERTGKIINGLNEKDLDAFATVIVDLVEAAAEYWRAYTNDFSDFCIQDISGSTVVFGGTNRLIWNPYHGFVPDKSHCTPGFYQKCRYIGPIPRRTMS